MVTVMRLSVSGFFAACGFPSWYCFNRAASCLSLTIGS
jgi:hypothetical protein